MPAIPDKRVYKIGEVCHYTDTQPYVLRFWESEFPQLAPQKNRSGQRVYRREDIELIERIKKLLYEEEYTIAGARKRLEQEPEGDGAAAVRLKPGRGSRDKAGAAKDTAMPAPGTHETDADMAALRRRLAEAEREADGWRSRCLRVADRLEGLLERLEARASKRSDTASS